MFPEIAQLSPAVWGILIAAAAALVVTVVLTCRASSLSTRKMVTIAMLIAVYVVLSLVGTLNLCGSASAWILCPLSSARCSMGRSAACLSVCSGA